MKHVDRWLFDPAPALRLAVFRILTGVFAVGYLLARLPVFLAMVTDDAGFDPVGVLWWLPGPVDDWLIRAAVIATLGLGCAYTLGVAFRWAGPLFALALLTLTTYRSSLGQLLWFENLVVLHVLIVGWSRAADASSLFPRRGPATATDSRYGWPLRLAAVLTVATYVLAGVAKLRSGGMAWIDGESLRNHVAFSAARLRVLGGTPSPVAGAIVPHVWLFAPMAMATMVVELGAPLALLSRRLSWIWVTATWIMHAGIAATMYVVFPYPLTLVAFAPLFALERLMAPVVARRARTPA